jgi:hypothetical protein
VIVFLKVVPSQQGRSPLCSDVARIAISTAGEQDFEGAV